MPPAAAPPPTPDSVLARELAADKVSLRWAPAQVLVDRPSKISSNTRHDASKTFEKDLISLVGGAQKSVFLVSPYFVPGSLGIEIATALRSRGVRLVILTNSLAATDAPAVLCELRPRVKPNRAGAVLAGGIALDRLECNRSREGKLKKGRTKNGCAEKETPLQV